MLQIIQRALGCQDGVAVITATITGRASDVQFSEQRGEVAARLLFIIASRRYVGSQPTTTRIVASVWGRMGQRLRKIVVEGCQIVATGELALTEHSRLALNVDHLEVVRQPLTPQSVTVTVNGH